MIEYDLQSKCQVQETALSAPGTCLICSTHQGPFIFTGRHIELAGERTLGAIIICRNCVNHLARQFGLFTQEETDLDASFARGMVEGVEVGKELTINGFRTYLDSVAAAAALGTSDSVEDADGVAEDDTDSGADGGSATESSVPSDGSSRKRGRADVSLPSIGLSI